MPRVQGPPVVLSDEVIGLPGEAHLQGIVVDVNDRATDVVGMIEKDFPTTSGRPGGMIRSTVIRFYQFLTTGLFEMLHHFLS